MKRVLLLFALLITVCNLFAQDKIKTKTELIYSNVNDTANRILNGKYIRSYDTSGRITFETIYAYDLNPQEPHSWKFIGFISQENEYFYDEDDFQDSIVFKFYPTDGNLQSHCTILKNYDSLGRIRREIVRDIRDSNIVKLTEFSYKDSAEGILITCTKVSIPGHQLEGSSKKIEIFNKEKVLAKTIETINDELIITTNYIWKANVLTKEINKHNTYKQEDEYNIVREEYSVINGVSMIISSIESKDKKEISERYESVISKYYSYGLSGNLIEMKYLVDGELVDVTKFEYQYW